MERGQTGFRHYAIECKYLERVHAEGTDHAWVIDTEPITQYLDDSTTPKGTP